MEQQLPSVYRKVLRFRGPTADEMDVTALGQMKKIQSNPQVLEFSIRDALNKFTRDILVKNKLIPDAETLDKYQVDIDRLVAETVESWRTAEFAEE